MHEDYFALVRIRPLVTVKSDEEDYTWVNWLSAISDSKEVSERLSDGELEYMLAVADLVYAYRKRANTGLDGICAIRDMLEFHWLINKSRQKISGHAETTKA